MKKMEIDINKPADFKPDGGFWRCPGSALWIYLVLIMTSLYLWQGQEVQRSKVPYNRISATGGQG